MGGPPRCHGEERAGVAGGLLPPAAQQEGGRSGEPHQRPHGHRQLSRDGEGPGTLSSAHQEV